MGGGRRHGTKKETGAKERSQLPDRAGNDKNPRSQPEAAKGKKAGRRATGWSVGGKTDRRTDVEPTVASVTRPGSEPRPLKPLRRGVSRRSKPPVSATFITPPRLESAKGEVQSLFPPTVAGRPLSLRKPSVHLGRGSRRIHGF